MAASGSNNIIARRVVDDLIDFSSETDVPNYMRFFFLQQIAEIHGYVSRQRAEAQTARNNLGQLRAMLAELEAVNDNGETKDPKLCLRADIHEEESRLEELEDVIVAAEDRIQSKEAHVWLMERQEAFVGRVVD
ncbi:hypothetical protein Tco_0155769 [Tanacetum coccineum]